MLSIQLTSTLEKQFKKIVQNNYQGDMQAAFQSFLKLHDKYGWKEQLLSDVQSVRSEVIQNGGIKTKTIDEAVIAYRKKTYKISNG